MPAQVVKNHFASEFIYNKYKDMKTVGVIERDEAAGMTKYAEPVGIIAGVVPTTNPTSTAIFKVRWRRGSSSTQTQAVDEPDDANVWLLALCVYVYACKFNITADLLVVFLPELACWCTLPPLCRSCRLPMIGLICVHESASTSPNVCIVHVL